MLLAWKIKALVAAVVAPLAISAFAPIGDPWPTTSHVPIPDLVDLRPGAFRYRASGDFTREGNPAPAPIATVAIKRTLAVMRHQVTAADYSRCVVAGACPTVDNEAAASDRPAVNVSWRDAHAYASWLSRATGIRFRLPTDEEWVFAAASRFKDDVLPDAAYDRDPGLRVLAIYDVEAGRRARGIDGKPQPIGSFGANENGLLDVAGNVWEWTDTCFVRGVLDTRGETAATTVNCGIRVVEGRHRAYVPDFVRDARTGGCSVGVPPSNLGFRLVHEDDAWSKLYLLLGLAQRR